MVWNAVPVEFAKHLALVIYKDIYDYLRSKDFHNLSLKKEKTKKQELSYIKQWIISSN